MTSAKLICSSPHHEGHRLIPSRYDAVERRTEYRAVIDQARVRTRTTGIVCRPCMTRELDGELVPELFGGVS